MNKIKSSLNQISIVFVLTILVLLLGTLCLVMEAVRFGAPISAVGIVLISIVVAVIVYKSHLAAATAKRSHLYLLQLSRQIARGQAHSAAEKRPVSHVSDRRTKRIVNWAERQFRLRSTGVYKPQVKDHMAKGRNAAAVIPDGLRPFRLYAATFAETNRPSGAESLDMRATVAIIGSDTLHESLASEFKTVDLHPGLAEAQFAAEMPSAVIVEETALQMGAWATALSANGTPLLQEILAVRNQAVAEGIQVFVIPSSIIDVSTRVLRDRATTILDDSYCEDYRNTRDDTEDYPQNGSLLRQLVDYLSRRT